MRRSQMLFLGQCLPGIAVPTPTPTHAVWPVWANSARHQVKPPKPATKAEAVRLWHRLREFERQTRRPGRQDGTVTRNGLAVAHALIFDFLNHRTGRLDPAYETIARKAAISIRSVARGLQALKAAGVLAWVRRCVEVMRDGRYSLEQESNLYHLQPVTAWRGYDAPREAPAPEAGTWGDHPCGIRDALTEAVADIRQGAAVLTTLKQLENDPRNPLAAALARLGRAIEAHPLPECQPGRETSLGNIIR